MPKRAYLFAIACYLAIPVLIIGAAGLHQLIDPEMARGSSHYVRNFRLLSWIRYGVWMGAWGLALVLWALTCYALLRARGHLWPWLALAIFGPFGFIAISWLNDRAPQDSDHYQHLLRRVPVWARIIFEIAMFCFVWWLAFELSALWRDFLVQWQSWRTGTPVADILAGQDRASGMWAFGEFLEAMYLMPLIYLFWPLIYNGIARIFAPRPA